MEKNIIQVQERAPQLIDQLLKVWESSVRATHDFLSEEEIIKIREYVPMAIENAEHLIIAEKESGEPVAFMGIDGSRLETLFLSPEARGKGLGKQLLQYGIETYNIQELTVNEQNPQAVGFYEHMGFQTYKRTDHDEEGNPYPLLYMSLTSRQKLINQIEKYKPYNEQEERDKNLILDWIRNNENAFFRENTVAHMTASAWVINKEWTKVLMVYHNIYNSWSWLGGHADGETDLLSVAIREVKEEAGISNVRPVSEEIFSMESLTVDGHVKKGKYVSSHLHFNITYLLEADPKEAVSIKADENSGVAWFSPEEALERSTEPWFVERIYTKLLEKMNDMKENCE